ncbi:imidazolonepropionase [soil metagenome]
MSEVSLLIHDLAQAVTPKGSGPLRGSALGDLQIQTPASVAISGEEILAVGPPEEVLHDHPPGPECVTIDGRGKVGLPGLIDCHAHPAFLGDRTRDFELRASGAGYEEMHSSGQGILSTVRATREGTEKELQSAVSRHLDWMLEHGTTTAEAKSGYGLDEENEIKSLRAIEAAAAEHPIDVHPTFLGAHTVPPEFDGPEEHVEYLVEEVLPEAARHARAADVFVERGSFEVPEARRYLKACARHGLSLRIHGDQFTERGAIPLAIELDARSVDHLERTGEEGVRLLAKSEVTAVLLPACALFLDLQEPPARRLVEEGAIVALSTDFNPGSSYTESLPLVMNLACTRLKLSPAEALSAVTANAAHVLGVGDVGHLAPGYKADVLVLDAPDWRHLAYHLGGDRFAARIKSGRLL